METKVYYFSATGNSLAAARILAERLGAGRPAEMGRALDADRSIGVRGRAVLVFPLFFQGYPELVRRFVAALEPASDTDIAAVVTRGFAPSGGVLGLLASDMARKGVALRYGVYLDMPNNELLIFRPHGGAKAQRRLDQAQGKLERIAAEISGGVGRRDAEPIAFIRGIRTREYRARMARAHRDFRVNGRCTGCGTCAALCALSRIRLEAGRPVWSAGCQLCEGCINLCPRRAIDLAGSRSEGNGRYRHSGISAAELAAREG